MVRNLVEHGACMYATTISDRETPAQKCEEDEEGFQGCSDYLFGKLRYYGHHVEWFGHMAQTDFSILYIFF